MAQCSAWLAAALLVMAALAAAPAAAQDIVLDGETINPHDIDQRPKFDLLASHRVPSREQVIDELRRETLLMHEAHRHALAASDTEVEQAYANMAARMRLTAAQLTDALAHQGIEANTLKRHIRADIARVRLRRSPGGPVPTIDPPFRPRWCAECLRFGDIGLPAPARRAAEAAEPNADRHGLDISRRDGR